MNSLNKEQPEEINPSQIKSSLGKRVEALAFGLCYAGKLTKIDLKEGTIRIEDEKDYVILEIERIESFKALEH